MQFLSAYRYTAQVIQPTLRKPMLEDVPGTLQRDDIEHLLNSEPFLRVAPMPITKKLKERSKLAHGPR